MGPVVVGFMLALSMVLIQSAIFGMIALWIAGRRSRIVRTIGGVFITLVAWMSVVPIIDQVAGYHTRQDVPTNIATIATILLGWIAGHNRRIRRIRDEPSTKASRLVFETKVEVAGGAITIGSALFASVVSFTTFVWELGIVSDAVGFWGSLVALALAPFTFALAPLYAGVHLHNWALASLCYLGTLTGVLCFAFGQLVADERVMS